MRPLIGVTGPDRGGFAAWIFIHFALLAAGARAVRITPSRAASSVNVDGLILGGGADLMPSLYGLPEPDAPAPARKRPLHRKMLDLFVAPLAWLLRTAGALRRAERFDPNRDKLELEMLKTAIEKRLPVLGICRGEQLLNVFFGGTLLQDLRSFYVETPEIRTILPRKEVAVMPGTMLSSIIGDDPAMVNALHYQAIDKLGIGLRVAARDKYGIIQAVEHETLRFVIGVQWHPEFLPQTPRQRRLFAALVERAAQSRSGGPFQFPRREPSQTRQHSVS